MEKKNSILVPIIFLLVGIIIGIFVSPIRQGIGNNCLNSNCCGKEHKKE